RLVLDHHRLAERLRQRRRDDARGDVVDAARREVHHHPYRLRWIGLPARGGRHEHPGEESEKPHDTLSVASSGAWSFAPGAGRMPLRKLSSRKLLGWLAGSESHRRKR